MRVTHFTDTEALTTIMSSEELLEERRVEEQTDRIGQIARSGTVGRRAAASVGFILNGPHVHGAWVTPLFRMLATPILGPALRPILIGLVHRKGVAFDVAFSELRLNFGFSGVSMLAVVLIALVFVLWHGAFRPFAVGLSVLALILVLKVLSQLRVVCDCENALGGRYVDLSGRNPKVVDL